MIKYIGRISVCALVLVVGTMLGGMASAALHLAPPQLPGQVDTGKLMLLTFAGAVVLAVALAELSRQLSGNRRTRFAVIAWLAFAWLGINNTLEASIFTTIGGAPSVVITMLFSVLFAAGAVALLFGGRGVETPSCSNLRQYVAGWTAGQWTFRLGAAVIAFPVIYFLFGTPVGLVVAKFYQNQQFGLQMPSLDVIVGVQVIRSLIALLAALPVLLVWPGSRSRFAWTFGLSLFVISGLYGLLQGYWLPWMMRGIHTVELLLDSLAYGWVIAVLLLRPSPGAQTSGSDAVGEDIHRVPISP